MADEIHLPDGTITDADTGDVVRSAREAVTEAQDYRITAARNFLATAPESDFSKLLADVVSVADDYMTTDLDETRSQVTVEGGIYLCPADVAHLCPTCLNLATTDVTVT